MFDFVNWGPIAFGALAALGFVGALLGLLIGIAFIESLPRNVRQGLLFWVAVGFAGAFVVGFTQGLL